jgi:hypothetical protein
VEDILLVCLSLSLFLSVFRNGERKEKEKATAFTRGRCKTKVRGNEKSTKNKRQKNNTLRAPDPSLLRDIATSNWLK